MLRLFVLAALLAVLFPAASCRSVPLDETLIKTAPVVPLVASVEEQKKEPTNLDSAMLVVLTPKYRLFYPLALDGLVPFQLILARAEAAYKRVEGVLGAFEQRVDITLTMRIVSGDPDFPKNLTIAGVTFVENGQINVVVALWAAGDIEVLSHELLHARLRDLGINPPRWLEEGLAHMIETEDGFSSELFEILENEGVLTPAEVAEAKTVSNQEMRVRATGWAIAYYLVKLKGWSVEKVAKADPTSLPEPSKVLEEIRAHRAKNSKAPADIVVQIAAR